MNIKLKLFIISEIKRKDKITSAKSIAFEWNKQTENKKEHITHESIYKWLEQSRNNKYRQYLLYKKGYKKVKTKKGSRIIGRIPLDKRPAEANNRSELGHFEADLVVSKKGCKSAILTLIDRKSRLPRIHLIKDKSSANIMKIIKSKKEILGIMNCPLKSRVKIKKDGFKRGKQRYKCLSCNHVFQNKKRIKRIGIVKLWNEYCFGKQNYFELPEKYKVTIKTIQKRLDEYEFIPLVVTPTEIILLIDTTYFSDFGIMVFKDYKSKRVIYYKIVKNENNTDYKNGVKELQKKGWIIKAIVCDGRKGLLTGFPDIPTQMCNFYQ